MYIALKLFCIQICYTLKAIFFKQQEGISRLHTSLCVLTFDFIYGGDFTINTFFWTGIKAYRLILFNNHRKMHAIFFKIAVSDTNALVL